MPYSVGFSFDSFRDKLLARRSVRRGTAGILVHMRGYEESFIQGQREVERSI